MNTDSGVERDGRFVSLDGWRGISILLVLAAHLLPLGPKPWQLNVAAGLLGMALFFTLSGFLVTHFLLRHASTLDFLIRRFFRIVPLAWLYLAVVLLLQHASAPLWREHLLFYANLVPEQLTPLTAHIWSLCVEVQFYVGIALLHRYLRLRGLMLIPVLCLAVTVLRVANDMHYSIISYFRGDEILAGGILALIYDGKVGARIVDLLKRPAAMVAAPLLIISCLPDSGFMNYLRPYFAAVLVGATLFQPDGRLVKVLAHKGLSYIAAISYALYVLHPLLASTWLGSGETLVKYLKRPFLILVTFFAAHISTFSFEHRCMAFGRKLSFRFATPMRVASPKASET